MWMHHKVFNALKRPSDLFIGCDFWIMKSVDIIRTSSTRKSINYVYTSFGRISFLHFDVIGDTDFFLFTEVTDICSSQHLKHLFDPNLLYLSSFPAPKKVKRRDYTKEKKLVIIWYGVIQSVICFISKITGYFSAVIHSFSYKRMSYW